MLQKSLEGYYCISGIRFTGSKGENHEALWVTSWETLLRNLKPLWQSSPEIHRAWPQLCPEIRERNWEIWENNKRLWKNNDKANSWDQYLGGFRCSCWEVEGVNE